MFQLVRRSGRARAPRRRNAAPGLRAVGAPVRDERDLRAAGDQVPRRLTRPSFPGADHEHGAAVELAENLLGEGSSRRRNRCRALADRRLVRAFLPACSAWRKSRSRIGPVAPASCAARTCPRISPSPGTIESRPGRDAEEVQRRRLVAQPVERGAELLFEREQRSLRLVLGLRRQTRRRGRAPCGCRSRGRPPHPGRRRAVRASSPKRSRSSAARSRSSTGA